MLPEEAYFSVQETLTSPTPNRTDSVQLFASAPYRKIDYSIIALPSFAFRQYNMTEIIAGIKGY